MRAFPQSVAPCCLAASLLLWWQKAKTTTEESNHTHALGIIFPPTPHLSSFFWSGFFFFVFVSTSNEDRATRLLLHRISCTPQANKSKLVCGCVRAAINLGVFSFFSSNFSVFLQRDSAAFSQLLLNHAVSADFLGADWLVPSPLITEG